MMYMPNAPFLSWLHSLVLVFTFLSQIPSTFAVPGEFEWEDHPIKVYDSPGYYLGQLLKHLQNTLHNPPANSLPHSYPTAWIEHLHLQEHPLDHDKLIEHFANPAHHRQRQLINLGSIPENILNLAFAFPIDHPKAIDVPDVETFAIMSSYSHGYRVEPYMYTHGMVKVHGVNGLGDALRSHSATPDDPAKWFIGRLLSVDELFQTLHSMHV